MSEPQRPGQSEFIVTLQRLHAAQLDATTPEAREATPDTTRFETRSAFQLDRDRRTFSTRFGSLRADGVNNLDASLIKNTQILERLQVQIRFEMFNVLNRTQFNGPELNPTNANFGKITSAANLPRAVQLGIRLRW